MAFCIYSEADGDRLNFESIAGPSTQEQAYAANEFYQTRNGAKLYRRLKELEAQVQTTLRQWDNAKNNLRRFQNTPKDLYYHTENMAELNKPDAEGNS